MATPKSKKAPIKTNTPPRHAGGRPTVYSDEIITKSKAYLESCIDEQKAVVSGESDNFTKYDQKLIVKLPTIEGLAYHLSVSRVTLYEWKKEYKEFSYIIEELKQKQAERLICMGLSGDYNSTIVKLMLNKHGYSEKQEIDHTTGGDKITAAPAINVYSSAPPLASSEDVIDEKDKK